MRDLEIVGEPLGENRRRKGPEGLASLDPLVEVLLHLFPARVGGTAFYREVQEKGHLLTDDWSKYSGFDHVVVRTDELDAEAVGQALARARRSIYFSPRFIRRRLGYIRNLRDVSALARKAVRLLGSSAFDRAT